MNLQNARYVIDDETNQNIAVVVNVDGVEKSVPLDPANRHYAEIMRQVEAGELTIQDAE